MGPIVSELGGGPMIAHVARWVLPVATPPIRDGAVLVTGERILAVGPADEVLWGFAGEVRDHGAGALLPGLVNCHTHLEFSALAGRIPPQARWEEWLAAILAASAQLTPEEVKKGVFQGIAALRKAGAVLVGEVSNTGLSLPFLEEAPLKYHYFYECLGFDLLDLKELEATFPFLGSPRVAENPGVSAAAHAPYSVSPPLFRAIGDWNGGRRRPQTVHLSESRAELDFLIKGDGFLREVLKSRGRWVEGFRAPGLSPTAYLGTLDFLGPRTLTVHGVWLDAREREFLAQTHTWLVLCPRANRYTGAGTPRVRELLQAGVPLALGTDSLAGNWDLNLFGEMLWLKEHFPEFPGDLWLRLATLNGALALGRDADFGALTPGRKAALGFVLLTGDQDFWIELFTAGAAGAWRWVE